MCVCVCVEDGREVESLSAPVSEDGREVESVRTCVVCMRVWWCV